jgi:hypothetical protein
VLHQHLYTSEKLREFQSQRMTCAQAVAPPPGKPALAPLARPLGRVLHGLGHRLESWATAPAEIEPAELRLRGRTR